MLVGFFKECGQTVKCFVASLGGVTCVCVCTCMCGVCVCACVCGVCACVHVCVCVKPCRYVNGMFCMFC